MALAILELPGTRDTVFSIQDLAGISPELAALHTLAPRIEDGAACLVGKQFRRGLQDLEQPGLQRRQKRRGPAHPIGERGAVEIDALAAIDLRLPVQRTVMRYCTAWGRARRTALTRAQSRPSNKADACAGDRRMTPSSILGQRNFASSSRL